MAESESGQDKTEDPTARRLDKSRADGQIPRSRELSAFLVLVSSIFALRIFFNPLAAAMEDVMRASLSFERGLAFDSVQAFSMLHAIVVKLALALFPIFLVLVVVSVASVLVMGGWNFSSKSFAPQFSRMSPMAGIKRMFSTRSLMELVKALLKFVLVASVTLWALHAKFNELLSLSQEPIEQAMAHALSLFSWVSLWVCSSLLLVVLMDVPFQIWQQAQALKMTKQEVKDEMKDSEGRPEVKSRIRRLQREMAEARMMSKVPQADVIITNPEHYAVALKYDGGKHNAPILVAKGIEWKALKIREIAAFHNVRVLTIPPLARSIYHTTELNRPIPAGLYLAVAQVLAYLYQVDQHKAGRGAKPRAIPPCPIPDDLRY